MDMASDCVVVYWCRQHVNGLDGHVGENNDQNYIKTMYFNQHC